LPLFIGLPGVIWLASLSGKQEESARRQLAIQMSFATAIAITLAVGLSIFKLVTVQGHMNMNWPLKHWVRMSIELYLHAFGAVYWQLGANLPIDAVSIILGPNRRLGPVLSGAFGALLMSYALITMEQQVGNSRVELVSRKVVPVALMVGLA